VNDTNQNEVRATAKQRSISQHHSKGMGKGVFRDD